MFQTDIIRTRKPRQKNNTLIFNDLTSRRPPKIHSDETRMKQFATPVKQFPVYLYDLCKAKPKATFMRKFYITLFMVCCVSCGLMGAGCDDFHYVPDHSLVEEPEDPKPDGPSTLYTVNLADVQQQIDNFGASDAWSIKYLGKNWPSEKRERIADLLFSRETDASGNPKGIGLSLWRVNFGGGSLENPCPNTGNIWANMPCMRAENGAYQLNMNDPAGGQFWMLKAAKERGCEQFLGFVNSPPYYWTYTGYTTALLNPDYQYKFNLKEEHYADYAGYLAELVKQIREKHGVEINYVCPVNEPEWEADGTESCYATNTDIATIAKQLGGKFAEEGLSTQVVVSETGKHQYVYGFDWDHKYPLDHGNKAGTFFGQAVTGNSLKDAPNVAQLIASHSYWTVNTDTQLRQIREKVGEAIKKYGIKFWQTEFCILSDDYDLGTNPDGTPVGGSGVDLTMKLALYVARIIHADLVFANASAWHWWLAVTPFDYKDGLICISENTDDGEIRVPKLLWALGNYSRFIRPGAYRLGVTSSVEVSDLRGVMTSAYKNTDGKLVVVMINFLDETRNVSLAASDNASRTFVPYLTSDSEADNLRLLPEVASDEAFALPAKSIVTFCEQ